MRAIRLPIVHIGLASEKAAYDTIALIDSGATTTHIPREDAEILQLEYKKDDRGELRRMNTQGAGGDFMCNLATIKKLDVMKKLKPFTTFRSIEVLVPESRVALP